MRDYYVTYKTRDGQQHSEVMAGRNHSDIERKIAAMGGTVVALERNEEDSYPRKSRSKRRTIGCTAAVILVVVLAITLYWQYLHR